MLYLLLIPQEPPFQSEANAWSEVFKEKQWRRISQLAARSSREVEGILASCFSQSAQLEGMFVCGVTGYGKMQCFCNISVAYARTSKPYMSSSQGVAQFSGLKFILFTFSIGWCIQMSNYNQTTSQAG